MKISSSNVLLIKYFLQFKIIKNILFGTKKQYIIFTELLSYSFLINMIP